LFGHEKGAFTGAVARRIGKFEEAERRHAAARRDFSEMDVRLQAKLLRAMQEREIDRVGGSKPVKVNIRVLATSNRDLRRGGTRRQRSARIYCYRLNVVNLAIPPLQRPSRRHRWRWPQHFLKRYSRKANGVD
jgi:two-component system response regulator FlrC